MHLRSVHQLISLWLLSLTLNGFLWFYRQDIQQGNVITDTEIAQLREGMTVNEVKKLLGTPVLVQTLLEEVDKNERTQLFESTSSESPNDEEKDLMKMEYVYFYQPGYGKPTRKRISLIFSDEKLIKFRVLTE